MNLIRTLFSLILMFAAGATGATEINVTDGQGAPGDPVVMTISLANSTGTTFISGRLNFPDSAKTNLAVTSLQPGVVFCSVLAPGVIQFQVGSPPRPGESPVAPDADGNACQLSFTITPTATPSDYPLFWTNTNCGSDPVCDANGAFLTVLGPDFTSAQYPGDTLTINATVGGAPGTTLIDTSNTGTTDLTILPTGLSAPLSVSPATEQTLVPSGGDERTIFTVSCDTADGGVFTQTLNFATNDPDKPSLNFPIDCTVDGPEADFSPASGTIEINTATGVQGNDSLLLQNVGTQPLTITPSAVPAPFTTDGPTTLPPGGNGLPFFISCNSATPGNFTTPFTITTNDANETTFTYTLACNVGPQDIDTNPPAGTPISIATPPDVATTSLLQITNAGGSFLYPVFSGLSPPLSIAPSQKISVAPGVTRDFTITCDSPTIGTFSQVLSIASNDPDEPTITFPVTCTVGGPEFDPTPAAGSTIALAANVGASASGSIAIANTGSGALVVDASGLSGVLSVSPPQLSVAAGTSASFTLGCAPTTFATTSQTLTLATNDTDEASAAYTVQCTGIDPGPRAIAAASGAGQTAIPNGQGLPLVAQLTQGGLPLAGEAITWSLVAGSDVNIAQPVTTTDAQGRAQTDISFGPNPTSATIEARDNQNNTATFAILVPPVQGPSVSLQITGGDNQTGAVGSNSDQPIIFETTSGDLSPAPGVQLTFVVSSGTATLPVTAASTDANGQFALSFRYGDTAGPIRIKATIAGTIESVEARATAFAPSITPASGGGQSGPPGTRLPQPFVVAIAPPPAGATLAKGLAGTTVTWTVIAGGGSVVPASNQTDANGRASAQLTLGPAPGVNQVRASIAGAGSVTFTATATSGGAIVFEQVSGNNQILTGSERSDPLVVRARDGSTPIASARVRWIVPESVSASATETTTGADGETSITAVLQGQNGETIFAELVDFPGAASIPFVLSRGIANAANGTPEEEVGAALDSGCPALEAASSAGTTLTNAQRDLLARCREIAAATGDLPGAVDNALNELLADEVEAQNTAIITTQSAQFGNLKARIAALRSGQNNSFGGLALNTATGPLPLSFLPSTLLQDDAAGGTSDEAGAGFKRWGFFATGTVGSGDRDQTESNSGFDYSNYSLTAGVDYRVNDSLILGAALGFGNNDTDLKDDGGGLDTSSLSLSGYATYYKGDAFYLDGVFTYGRNDFDVARRIDYALPTVGGGITQVDQLATASTEGNQTSFALSFGKDFVRGAWMMGPYVRATYTKIDFDGYVEEASDPGAPGAGLVLAVDDRELLSKELVLGGKLTYTMSTSWGILMPNFAFEYLHELEDNPDALITRFVADPTGTPIIIDSEALDRDYFNIGIGLSAIFANGKSAFVYYEHRAGQADMSMDNLAIGVRIEF